MQEASIVLHLLLGSGTSLSWLVESAEPHLAIFRVDCK